ncbi:MAG: glycine--tRNA ligase subunit beta [Gammaproteobacteria bacterium]|nr:MAG: glycine--tRNA ligase subunit beta [Gammaproteobacteria bacterium]
MTSHKDFIVELGTEELPPLSLETLARAFHQNLLQLIDEKGLDHQQSHYYATPRRLTVVIEQLAIAQADKTTQRQGPAVESAFDADGNPTQAATGFARSCGVAVKELEQLQTTKGLRLAFQISEKGKPATELLPELTQLALNKLPIAKTMHWGDYDYSFIRPVKWLLMMQGEDVIPCTLYDCASSNITHGHRFLAAGDLTLSSAKDYLELLESHYVIADIETRKNKIREQVLELAKDLGATAVIDPQLLDEVSALVEWPVALSGDFEQEFLSVPQEALISTMAKNQKYFHLQDDNEQLLAKFITIANIQSYNPKAIIEGNERVIRPRLADAKFFFEQDCKHSLTSKLPQLEKIVFQKQLGSLFDKTVRIKKLAVAISSKTNVDTANIELAATICKSDLVTNMVGEFPSLQGIMGRYYALNDGQNEEVAQAMDEIYLPRFAGDKLPETQTGLYLALADRLDTLTGIFATGQIPTGNKDPFALRRATLGILRIIIEKQLPLDLKDLVQLAASNFSTISVNEETITKILDFFAARIKAMYLDQGFSSTIIQSVQELEVTVPLDIDARIKAVKSFNDMEQAESLAKANKRVANILSKNSFEQKQALDDTLLLEPAELQLAQVISKISPEVKKLCENANYTQALSLLAQLNTDIDNFFDSVMVMDEDMALRQNRLTLLNQLRNLFIAIADISCLQK